MMSVKRLNFPIVRLVLLIFISISFGCSEDAEKSGILATVNGEPITLREVQALMDSRFATFGLRSDESIENVKKNYAQALSIQIANTLVRQELVKRGIAPSEFEVNQAIERISSEYGNENLELLLDDAMLRLEEWQMLMRDHLALEIFRNQILLPGIKIEIQDIKNYYQEHKKEFIVPETARTCFLSSKNREDINNWCNNISDNSFMDNSISQCVEIAISEIPQPWNKEIKNLKPLSCGKIREMDDEWQALALLEKQPERIPELSEVFSLVEKLLLEPRQSAAFDQWLEQKTKNSKVMVVPEILKYMNARTTDEEGDNSFIKEIDNHAKDQS